MERDFFFLKISVALSEKQSAQQTVKHPGQKLQFLQPLYSSFLIRDTLTEGHYGIPQFYLPGGWHSSVSGWDGESLACLLSSVLQGAHSVYSCKTRSLRWSNDERHKPVEEENQSKQNSSALGEVSDIKIKKEAQPTGFWSSSVCMSLKASVRLRKWQFLFCWSRQCTRKYLKLVRMK